MKKLILLLLVLTFFVGGGQFTHLPAGELVKDAKGITIKATATAIAEQEYELDGETYWVAPNNMATVQAKIRS